METKINIYQMYINNGCHLGFYVHKDSWHPSRYAKVVSIEDVEEGKMIEGDPPYFGGRKFPPGHPKEGKTMGPREVTIVADWLDGGKYTVNGGIYAFTQVYPENPRC